MEYFELRRDFDSSLNDVCHRDPSPATARQSRGPDLLMRPSQAHKSARFFVVGYFMGEYEIRRDFDSSLSAAPCRYPPPATVRLSWYPDVLMRPSQASISRLAELKCCASKGFSTDTFCTLMSARARWRAPAQSQALACRRRSSARYRRDNPRARGPPRWGARACSGYFPCLLIRWPFASDLLVDR
jgi:hypothetical protein